ncbi:MAG TPA: peptidylprolyl isomerase [Elusimicrobiota bacterium]|nr:peptidylprolyl isomerase [Elusimicrobiota bacterium]
MMKKRFFSVAAGIALTGLFLSTHAWSKVVNKTIALVNGEAILLSEFEKNWDAFRDQQGKVLRPEQMTPEWEKDVKGKIFNQMVDDKVLLLEARNKKIRVNQRDLENGIIQVKTRFMPELGRRELERIVSRMMEGKTPEEQSKEPTMDLSAAWKELEKSNPDMIKECQKGFNQELVKEGLSEKKFEDRIRDQLSVVQLTNQEIHSRNTPPTDAEGQALFDKVNLIMQGKTVPGIDAESQSDLESLAKYFQSQTGERVRARHILLRVDRDASFKDKSQIRQKIEDLRKKIAGGEDFGNVAVKESDDKGSAVRGGDLGYFTRGQMVPEFEKAAFETAVGQVSPVVQTEFGYHIILVEEKKAATKLKYEDVSDDLKEYLYRTKAQSIFEQYVQDLRKNATVKVLINVETDL